MCEVAWRGVYNVLFLCLCVGNCGLARLVKSRDILEDEDERMR